MELREDTRYAYAVARIRALETHFLNLEKIQRIIDAPDALTAWRETAMWHLFPKGELSSEDTEKDLENLLIEEIRYTNNLFSSLSKDPELTNLFLLKYDFHNLKVLLKAYPESYPKGINSDNNGMIDSGLVPVEKLKNAISERNFRELSKSLQDIISEILEVVRTDTYFLYGPSMVDIFLDKKMFDLIFMTIKEYPAPSSFFLNTLFQLEVDINNLNICRRFKKLTRKRDFLNEAFLQGGKLDIKFLLERYENSEDVVLNEFINLQISNLQSQLNNLCESTMYTAFGLEPLIVFLKKREKETKIIRTIILAKLQGLVTEDIKKEIGTIK